MKSDRRLDQALQEFSLRLRRVSPHLLESFVGGEEIGLIE